MAKSSCSGISAFSGFGAEGKSAFVLREKLAVLRRREILNRLLPEPHFHSNIRPHKILPVERNLYESEPSVNFDGRRRAFGIGKKVEQAGIQIPRPTDGRYAQRLSDALAAEAGVNRHFYQLIGMGVVFDQTGGADNFAIHFGEQDLAAAGEDGRFRVAAMPVVNLLHKVGGLNPGLVDFFPAESVMGLEVNDLHDVGE
jgi:hypothetical protein